MEAVTGSIKGFYDGYDVFHVSVNHQDELLHRVRHLHHQSVLF